MVTRDYPDDGRTDEAKNLRKAVNIRQGLAAEHSTDVSNKSLGEGASKGADFLYLFHRPSRLLEFAYSGLQLPWISKQERHLCQTRKGQADEVR